MSSIVRINPSRLALAGLRRSFSMNVTRPLAGCSTCSTAGQTIRGSSLSQRTSSPSSSLVASIKLNAVHQSRSYATEGSAPPTSNVSLSEEPVYNTYQLHPLTRLSSDMLCSSNLAQSTKLPSQACPARLCTTFMWSMARSWYLSQATRCP